MTRLVKTNKVVLILVLVLLASFLFACGKPADSGNDKNKGQEKPENVKITALKSEVIAGESLILTATNDRISEGLTVERQWKIGQGDNWSQATIESTFELTTTQDDIGTLSVYVRARTQKQDDEQILYSDWVVSDSIEITVIEDPFDFTISGQPNMAYDQSNVSWTVEMQPYSQEIEWTILGDSQYIELQPSGEYNQNLNIKRLISGNEQAILIDIKATAEKGAFATKQLRLDEDPFEMQIDGAETMDSDQTTTDWTVQMQPYSQNISWEILQDFNEVELQPSGEYNQNLKIIRLITDNITIMPITIRATADNNKTVTKMLIIDKVEPTYDVKVLLEVWQDGQKLEDKGELKLNTETIVPINVEGNIPTGWTLRFKVEIFLDGEDIFTKSSASSFRAEFTPEDLGEIAIVASVELLSSGVVKDTFQEYFFLTVVE
jgi:hypothetical protein